MEACSCGPLVAARNLRVAEVKQRGFRDKSKGVEGLGFRVYKSCTSQSGQSTPIVIQGLSAQPTKDLRKAVIACMSAETECGT